MQDAAKRDRQQGTNDTAAVKSEQPVSTKPEQSEEPASASNGVVEPTPASSTSAASNGELHCYLDSCLAFQNFQVVIHKLPVSSKPEQSEEPASASNGVVEPTPASSTSAASNGALHCYLDSCPASHNFQVVIYKLPVSSKPEQSEEPASASNSVVEPTPASSTSAASNGALYCPSLECLSCDALLYIAALRLVACQHLARAEQGARLGQQQRV